MHPFSTLTLGIFVAGYITARWDLVTRLYELTIFAWNYGVVVCPPVAVGIQPSLTMAYRSHAPPKVSPSSRSCSSLYSYRSSVSRLESRNLYVLR